MSKLQELQEQRNGLAVKIKEFANKCDKETGWPDEETKKNWETLNSDYDSLTEQMDKIRQADSVTARLNRIEEIQNTAGNIQGHQVIPGRDNAQPMDQGGRQIGDVQPVCTEDHRCMALAAWMRNQCDMDVSPQHQQAAKLAGINLNRKSLNFASPSAHYVNGLAREFRSRHPQARSVGREFYNAPLTTATSGTGGDTIPAETLMREIEINMLAFGPMAQVAELMVTSGGETLSWPTVDDTDHTGVQIGENTDLSNSGSGGDAPDFAQVQWEAYKLSSQMILVPYELLEDNVVNLPVVLGQLIGERLGRFRNTRYTTGSGSSQANGIVTAATVGVTAASATAIASDEVYELQHSVDPAYRNGAAFMCNDNTVYYLRTLKDSDNRYLWQSGFNTGIPDTLAGAPLFINQDMASRAANAKTLLYGQLSKYKIRRVNGFRMYRLTERYRDTDQDGFMMIVREDGNLLDAGTPPVKVLEQAAS